MNGNITDSRDRTVMPDVQDLQSRIGALHLGLEAALDELATVHGKDARSKIEAMRDQLLFNFKNAGVPAEHDLDQARLVRPAIDVIQIVFDSALAKLPR